jgi:hypothetical protein
MPKTPTTCPRCRQPVLAEVEQLFDLNSDPLSKQRLLNGVTNLVHCQSCGYQGRIATPIVYHDPAKELLLTYFPPELGLPVNDQERMIGPLLNQVMNRLAPEKRKAYLLRPQTMLTYEALIEKVLEADGITKEIIQAQQQRLSLINRLATASSQDARKEIIHQETQLVDAEFFGILSKLAETAMAQGDQASVKQLAAIQQDLLTETDFGKNLASQAKEAEAAIRSLQDASKEGLTREKLLDLIIEAPTDTRLSALVGMARSGLDYEFFKLLTERIEQSQGEEKERLTGLRESLLKMVDEIDKAVQEKIKTSNDLLEKIVDAENLEKELEDHIQELDDFFTDSLRNEIEKSRQAGNLERLNKLENVVAILKKYSAPPEEIQIIEQLIQAPDEGARQKILEIQGSKITPEFVQIMGNIVQQAAESGQSADIVEKIQKAYREVLRFSMSENLKK